MSVRGVDERLLAAAERVLAEQTGEPVQLGELVRLQAGKSGLTFRARATGRGRARDVVLKVAPPGLAPVGNRDVLRQARVYDRLAQVSSVPVPQVLATCAEGDPDVPQFFVMDFVAGQCLEPTIDPAAAEIPAPVLRARMFAAVDVLARIHRVDPEQVGETPDPDGGLTADLETWSAVSRTLPDELRPGADEVERLLAGSIPRVERPTVVHGDYRLGNLVCRGDEIAAVLDWEIWTVTDPLVDLAWFLMSTQPDKQPMAIRAAEGMPDDDELIEAYRVASGRSLEYLSWFHAMSRFKAAAIIGQIVKHDRRRETRDPHVSSWDPHAPAQYLRDARAFLADA